MTNFNAAPQDERIEQLLQQNLAWAQENQKVLQQVKKYILLGRIMSGIYLFLIVAPMILGYFYLKPLLAGFMNTINPAGILNDLPAAKPGTSVQESKQELIDLLKDQVKGQNPVDNYKNILEMYKKQ